MISIIISAYNSEKTIEKAIKSCLNQTYKDLEIIVVEDCSTVPAYIVCSDGTLNTQSLFNS